MRPLRKQSFYWIPVAGAWHKGYKEIVASLKEADGTAVLTSKAPKFRCNSYSQIQYKSCAGALHECRMYNHYVEMYDIKCRGYNRGYTDKNELDYYELKISDQRIYLNQELAKYGLQF